MEILKSNEMKYVKEIYVIDQIYENACAEVIQTVRKVQRDINQLRDATDRMLQSISEMNVSDKTQMYNTKHCYRYDSHMSRQERSSRTCHKGRCSKKIMCGRQRCNE
jgi:hypothetical protein